MKSRLTTFLLTGLLLASPCDAQQLIADIRQGTNMALAVSPDGEFIVIDLVGQLWRLPITGGAASPLTPSDVSARNPRFSSDGKYLVYQERVAGQWDLCLLELTTGDRRRLTGPPHNEQDPEFSIDGASVVFASNRAGSYDIWELDLGSNNSRRVIQTLGDASSPSVSDTGAIAFINQHGNTWRLEILDAAGASSVLIETSHPLHAPSWRPGGGVILFTERSNANSNDIKMAVLSEPPVIKVLTQGEDVFGFRAGWISPADYLYTADGGIWRRTIAGTDRSPVQLFAGVGIVRTNHPLQVTGHAPVGEQVVQGIRAARKSNSGNYRAFTALGDLWLQEAGGEIHQLTDDVYLDIDPVFDTNDESIIFASDRAGKMDLWEIFLATNELVQLTDAPGNSFRPLISPDGNHVAFLNTMGLGPWHQTKLAVFNRQNGEPPRTLVDDFTDAGSPQWDSDGLGLTIPSVIPPASAGLISKLAAVHVDINNGTVAWRPISVAPAPENGSAGQIDPASADPLIAPVLNWMPQQQEHHYVVQVDRLFDGVRNQYRRHMDIHVTNGRITDVTARGLSPLPSTVVDGRSYTIIPALIDSHAHHSALGGERLGRLWLAYGVTTVREINSDNTDALERREAWASGRRLGPRLVLSSSRPIQEGNDDSRNEDRPVDVFQLHSQLPGRVATASLANARGLGRAIYSNSLYPAARYGINGLEHIGSRSEQPFGLERSLLGRTYQDVISILVQTRASVAPSLVAFGGFQQIIEGNRLWTAESAYAQLYSEYERRDWQTEEYNPATIVGLQETVATLVRAGGRISAGSDAPAVPYGLGLHAELALLAAAGLPNDQVLRIATADAALALGLEHDLGTVEVGKLADFLVLSGDPLTRITDSLRIEAVVKGGVWHDRQELMTTPR
jgi:Tol biopolymer transport system component